MNFDELKEARRSVRQYAKSEITKEELEKIVTDALNAPSWKNTEATRYYAAATAAAKRNIPLSPYCNSLNGGKGTSLC